METEQQYRAREAMCRQWAKKKDEDALFWLAEAEILSKLIVNARRLRVLDEKGSPDLGA